tara:strand:+ start:600 stop:761 length:162 start_codon:yes stop_codon:yes gene_type:complete
MVANRAQVMAATRAVHPKADFQFVVILAITVSPGGDGRDRTYDILGVNQTLYH